MRILFLTIFLFINFTFAQMDLSTPGGNSVLITVASIPNGAEVYVANTFIGRTTTQVRINANTPTSFRLRIPDSQYQEYNQDLSFATDNTVTVTVPQVGQAPIPPTMSTPAPIPSTSAPAAATTQAPSPTTQQVRAYRNIFFGMSFSELLSAVEADSEIVPTDEFLIFNVFVDGIPLKMLAEFNDDVQLVRLIFETNKVSISSYDADVKAVATRLSNFLTRAYGAPTAEITPPEFYSLRDLVTIVTLWEQPTQDKIAIVGIVDEKYEYYVRFVVLQDSLYNASKNKEAGDF